MKPASELEVKAMTELENRVSALERQQTGFEVKFEMYMQRMDKQLERIEEHQRQFEDRHDADMREIRSELRSIGKHVQNLTITAMASMGAIGIAVVAFIWSQASK